MPQYSVKVMCNECFQVHPMGISISWEDGPDIVNSVGEIEKVAALPSKVADLVNNEFFCPIRKVVTTQDDNEQIYLVPED